MNPRPAAGRIPATIVTGFLGAGKTTLIRHLVQNAEGRRIGLIVNEFGDVGFDGELLSDCGSESCGRDDVIELSNGCICCTVADEFLPAMERLLDRDVPPDHLVIETSGLALPQPLVKAFGWPSIRERVTIDGVVTVVDSEAVAAGRMASDEARIAELRAADDSLDHESPIEELFEDQLRCADLIVLAKADLVDEAGLSRVEAVIAPERRAEARTVRSSHGALPPLVLLGLGAAAETDAANRKSHHDEEGEEEHEHDDFTSFALEASMPDRAAALDRIRNAMAVDGVLRIKGHVNIAGKHAPLAVQAVGARVEAWFRTDPLVNPQLVVIGLATLDRNAVEAALRG